MASSIQLDDENDQIIKRLVGIVQTHEQFNKQSYLHSLLAVDFNHSTLLRTLTSIYDSSSYSVIMNSFAALTPENLDSTTLIEDKFKKIIVDGASQRYGAVHSFKALGTTSLISHLNHYEDSMKVMCGFILRYIVEGIESNTNVNSSLTTSQRFRSSAITLEASRGPSMSKIDELLTDVIKYTNFSPSQDASRYISDLFDTLMNNKNILDKYKATPIYLDKMMIKLVFIAYYPYFLFKYITNHIAVADLEAENKAPRNAYIRRYAVICAYVFQLYTMYTIYKLSARFYPTDPETSKLRLTMDTSILYLLNEEESQLNIESAVESLHGQTQSTFEKTRSLDSIAREIEAVRNNLKTIAMNEAELNADVAKSATAKWVWLSFLLLYIVFAVVVLVFLRENEMMFTGLYIVSGTLALILLIIGVVNVAKKA